MRITRIDFEGSPGPPGSPGRYAIAKRRRGSDQIEVTLLTPNNPEGREHQVKADCKDDILSAAQCLQYHLDGYDGCNSEIHDYYQQLLWLSDV